MLFHMEIKFQICIIFFPLYLLFSASNLSLIACGIQAELVGNFEITYLQLLAFGLSVFWVVHQIVVGTSTPQGYVRSSPKYLNTN